MKAVVIHTYGGPEVLKYEDFPDPVIGPGEVLIRVAAAGINPVDAMERVGMTKSYMPVKFPGVLGWDLSGTVVGIGADVKGLAEGDRVLAWAYHTYAELCAVDAHWVAKVPPGLDLIEAAALPLAALTGSQLVSVGAGVVAGQTVLVSGANGGVGRAAVFAAKELGAVVIAGVSTRRLEDAKDLGAHQVVALDDEAAWRALPPVDVVANTVRGKTAEALLAKVKPGGVFASATGAPENSEKYPSIRVVSFVSKRDTTALGLLAEAVRDGKLSIPIGGKLPLKDASIAHASVEQGGAGKLLLLP